MYIVLLSMFIFVIANSAITGYCYEEVTVEWWVYWEDLPEGVPTPNSYWLLKVTYSDDSFAYYDGWCADHDRYLSTHGSKSPVRLYSSTEAGLPDSISDDENWDVVNYIFNEWPTSDSGSVFNGATWMDIQQVVWNYTDAGYAPSASSYTPPEAYWPKVNAIIDHIAVLIEDDNLPTFGVLEAKILDMNNAIGFSSPKQLLFFIIPEIPLGVLGAAATMFGAFYTKMRFSRRSKED